MFNFREIFERTFKIYGIWPQARSFSHTHTHTHTSAQCSPASVGLAQARPNNVFSSYTQDYGILNQTDNIRIFRHITVTLGFMIFNKFGTGHVYHDCLGNDRSWLNYSKDKLLEHETYGTVASGITQLNDMKNELQAQVPSLDLTLLYTILMSWKTQESTILNAQQF